MIKPPQQPPSVLLFTTAITIVNTPLLQQEPPLRRLLTGPGVCWCLSSLPRRSLFSLLCHKFTNFTMDALNATTFASFNQTKDYFVVLEEVSKYNVQLNIVEKLWAAWYLWMQNDTLATGIMSFVLHELVYFGRCIPYMMMDYIPYFQQFRIQKQKVPTLKEQWDCAAIVLISHFTAELPQIWFFHPVATYLGMDYGVPFPPVWKMALQIAICFVMEDAWHYWFHRALHYGPLYKAIHKMHHTYSAPFGLAAEYASPIETALLGIGVVGCPVVLLAITGELHLFTMYTWIVLRLFQAIDSHSGYDFPWSLRHFLPVWAGAAHHDLHHEKFIGNYASSFRWWDYCLDTEAGAEAHKRRREKKLAQIKAKKAQ
ncbi:methylsterol monooxygenase [Fusarium oxysporum f. sp. radicis-lycopersici 26381]|uniref:Methylsterol monooxygenase n=1 Tax=Fusarium oxysporum Fo47 TaxID=660027 RepID=W9KIX5_FUSOX|nr:methylsterol monooxygenase [Fusarium oxysporum Fo47]EXA00965.1 methylsterol monooxygenase [Fusarium oxysporum f. sp. lycopersici MN25]EXL59648.1 methylsterol monooxygenase [Fusarium oxysporum f. sp. radicis-lycopersici 26381]